MNLVECRRFDCRETFVSNYFESGLPLFGSGGHFVIFLFWKQSFNESLDLCNRS